MAAKERREHPRIPFSGDLIVQSEKSGLMPGRGVDISESGMAALLPVELDTGEAVEVRFKLGNKALRTGAIVRHKNVFRHGLQFLKPLQELDIQATCPTCGGSGFIFKGLDEKSVAFAKTRCPDCQKGPA